MLGFVDDKHHYINNFQQNSKEFLVKAINKLVNT